jgi:hypothetical protein
MYKYFKGEKGNPFEIILGRAEIENKSKYPPESMKIEYNLPYGKIKKLSWAIIFWEREKMFEEKFNKNNFSIECWCEFGIDKNNWKKALNPPNKEKMFEIWNKNSLLQIGDKHQMDFEEIYNLYCNNR